MSPIIYPEAGYLERPKIIRAHPPTFKAFWPEVKGSYFFRHRRIYLDFLRHQGGKIFFLQGTPSQKPSFILMGNWRDREDIVAIWHLEAEGEERESLVLGAAQECFNEGAVKVITKLLNEGESAEFRRWGFDIACRIVLLEKRLYREPPPTPEKEGVRIVPFRKRALDEVLSVDAAAFDDFWSLDSRTIEAISTSCIHNVFLLACRGEDIIGYAIGGVNGRLGYLQRLGIDLRQQGRGVGQYLASSVLHTLSSLGATTAAVNTQEENRAALQLYLSLGFRETPGPRVIMEYPAWNEDRGGR